MNSISPQTDVVIVGGGVVGLCCALYLAIEKRHVVLVESRSSLGELTSTHNSGVIHAGIYYPQNSHKARLSVLGNKLLVQLLKQWKIPHRICGKLIVATGKNEIDPLNALYENGLKNGVKDLKLISRKEALEIEPNIQVEKAIFSPSTGVFDVADFIKALSSRAISSGATIVTDAHVCKVERLAHGLIIHTKSKGSISSRSMINSAGLFADEVAAICGEKGHKIFPCRGEYASVIPRKTNIVNGLVYPVPAPLSLGVHFTKTIDNELWLGPTAKYIKGKSDYESNRLDPKEFLSKAKKICPALNASDLRLGPSGIRPKRYGPGEKAPDFYIKAQKNDPRIIHLVGIESPGLTASPAIGQLACSMIEKILG